MKQPLVSIITVNYHVKEELFACLRSIRKSKPTIPYEIIVVDNNEAPTIKSDLAKQFPEIIYIKSPENKGFGAGNNLGANHAKGKYLFFLNPDTEMYPHTLNTLTSFLENDQQCGAVAPLLVDKAGRPFPLQGTQTLTPWNALFSISLLHKIFPKNPIAQSYWLTHWNKTKEKKVEAIPGTAFMIQKKLFETLGKFDENFFLYFEENDLCKRIKCAGYDLYITPRAKVMHLWERSTKKSNKNIQAIFKQSRYYYFKKNYGTFLATIVDFFLNISKQDILFLGVFILGIFLRFYNLQLNFFFDGEIGDNLLDIKNAFVHRYIPLLGPPTSHPWLFFGPLYYWIYGPILALYHFNPLSYAYFGAAVGVLTIITNYWFVAKLFDKNIALISSFLISISFIYLNLAHVARFFSVVPLLIYPFLFFVYKLVQGEKKYIFLIFLFLGIMLNFHYSPLMLIPFVISVFIWKKIYITVGDILESIIGIFLPLSPLLLYDSMHNFRMSIDFLLWIPYRFATFLHLYHKPDVASQVAPSNLMDIFSFFGSFIDYNRYHFLTVIIFLIVFTFVLKILIQTSQDNKNNLSLPFILLWGIWGIISITIHGSPPDHYYTPILAFPIILFSLLLSEVTRLRKIGMILCLAILLSISILNFSWLFSAQWFYYYKTNPRAYSVKEHVARLIVRDAQGRKFMFQRIGLNDTYQKQYAQDYLYLLWFYGNEPVPSAMIRYTVYDNLNIIPIKNISINAAIFSVNQNVAIMRNNL